MMKHGCPLKKRKKIIYGHKLILLSFEMSDSYIFKGHDGPKEHGHNSGLSLDEGKHVYSLCFGCSGIWCWHGILVISFCF